MKAVADGGRPDKGDFERSGVGRCSGAGIPDEVAEAERREVRSGELDGLQNMRVCPENYRRAGRVKLLGQPSLDCGRTRIAFDAPVHDNDNNICALTTLAHGNEYPLGVHVENMFARGGDTGPCRLGNPRRSGDYL